MFEQPKLTLLPLESVSLRAGGSNGGGGGIELPPDTSGEFED